MSINWIALDAPLELPGEVFSAPPIGHVKLSLSSSSATRPVPAALRDGAVGTLRLSNLRICFVADPKSHAAGAASTALSSVGGAVDQLKSSALSWWASSGSTGASHPDATTAQSTTPSIDVLQSLAIPLARFRQGRIKLPMFGANAYEVTFRTVQGGGLDVICGEGGEMVATFAFTQGGVEGFGKAVEAGVHRLRAEAAAARQGEALPVYEAPPSAPADAPPGYV